MQQERYGRCNRAITPSLSKNHTHVLFQQNFACIMVGFLLESAFLAVSEANNTVHFQKSVTRRCFFLESMTPKFYDDMLWDGNVWVSLPLARFRGPSHDLPASERFNASHHFPRRSSLPKHHLVKCVVAKGVCR